MNSRLPDGREITAHELTQRAAAARSLPGHGPEQIPIGDEALQLVPLGDDEVTNSLGIHPLQGNIDAGVDIHGDEVRAHDLGDVHGAHDRKGPANRQGVSGGAPGAARTRARTRSGSSRSSAAVTWARTISSASTTSTAVRTNDAALGSPDLIPAFTLG